MLLVQNLNRVGFVVPSSGCLYSISSPSNPYRSRHIHQNQANKKYLVPVPDPKHQKTDIQQGEVSALSEHPCPRFWAHMAGDEYHTHPNKQAKAVESDMRKFKKKYTFCLLKVFLLLVLYVLYFFLTAMQLSKGC